EDASNRDDDEDRGQSDGDRSRRGRRGGRRRRGGRDRDGPRDGHRDTAHGGNAPAGLEVIEPKDDASDHSGGNRGRSRRRRGGRDRDDRNRNRVADTPADGGEMLDAIASAPFLPLPGEMTAETTADAGEAATIET